MIYLENQFIVRFTSFNSIKFDCKDETTFRPNEGVDYVFGIRKVDDSTIILLDENPRTVGGIDCSEPINSDRLIIVGESKQIRHSIYKPGYAAPMTAEARKFLESEIANHQDMTADEASRFVCDLNSAQSSLRQMDDGIFADIMELDDDADVTETRRAVYKEIGRMISDYGGHSLLREIIVWN